MVNGIQWMHGESGIQWINGHRQPKCIRIFHIINGQ